MSQPENTSGTSDGKRPAILLVDDNDAVCTVMTEVLGRLPSRVYAASSVAEAMRFVESMGFNLVLIDVNLPDGSGTDLARTVRSLHPGTAIVVMSGGAGTDDARNSAASVADACISKPLGPGELTDLVRKLLSRDRGKETLPQDRPGEDERTMSGILSITSLAIPSSTRHLKEVRNMVRESLAPVAVPHSVVHQIVLAVDEAVSNAILHSCGNDGKESIDVEVGVHRDMVRITLGNKGPRFDPATFPHPDIQADVEAGIRPSLGIHVMRTVLDEMRYSHDGKKSTLVLVKRLKGHGDSRTPGTTGEKRGKR